MKKVLLMGNAANNFPLEQLKDYFNGLGVITRKHYVTTEESTLKTISKPVKDVTEAKQILKILDDVLTKNHGAIGLSAIQLGIPSRIALIKWKEERVELINPVVVEKELEFIHLDESCLSLPNTWYDVKRYNQVTITNNIIDGDSFRLQNEVYYYDKEDEKSNLIPIAVQHEIDHMDGITIAGVGTKSGPVRNGPKIGRNDPCPCKSGKKFKKCCGK